MLPRRAIGVMSDNREIGRRELYIACSVMKARRSTELLATGRCELQRYSTAKLHTDRVTGITPTGNQFAVACADGFALTARKVLLTGLTDEVPQIEGIDQLYAEAFTIALTAKQTLASRNGLPLSSWLTFQIDRQARGDAGKAFEGRVEIEIADAIAEHLHLGGR